MSLSLNTPTGEWFTHFLELTVHKAGAEVFEKACKSIHDKLLEISAQSLRNRKVVTTSFEYDLHEYHRSTKFVQLCSDLLPGRLADQAPPRLCHVVFVTGLHALFLVDKCSV